MSAAGGLCTTRTRCFDSLFSSVACLRSASGGLPRKGRKPPEVFLLNWKALPLLGHYGKPVFTSHKLIESQTLGICLIGPANQCLLGVTCPTGPVNQRSL